MPSGEAIASFLKVSASSLSAVGALMRVRPRHSPRLIGTVRPGLPWRKTVLSFVSLSHVASSKVVSLLSCSCTISRLTQVASEAGTASSMHPGMTSLSSAGVFTK